ncbi:diaminobutyrate acetyltransferase [Streptomonospora mangrovi]|uniref:diaminobutyrate acetyltransferase n=1 Tax=Streptomonospora mangrovi TaxID=2883123 RepID=UPI0038CD6699
MPHQQSHVPHGTRDDQTSAPSPAAPEPAVAGGADDGVRLAAPVLGDGPDLWRLARLAGLALNSPYCYTLWTRDFSATSVIARDADGQARGYIIGYVRPDAPDTYFLWQVGVDPAFRGRRLARRMIDHVGDRITERGLTHLEATVTPDNAASRALFASFARARGCEAAWSPLFRPEHFPAEAAEDDEYEDLVRIGPLGRAGS